MKIESLDHIHVYCADPESSALFYTEHFEAKELFRNENVHGQTRIFLSLGGLFLVLGPFPPDIAIAAVNFMSVIADIPLRTLDAMHLVIAKEIQAEQLATADRVMADAAELLGLSVVRFD